MSLSYLATVAIWRLQRPLLATQLSRVRCYYEERNAKTQMEGVRNVTQLTSTKQKAGLKGGRGLK